MCEYCGCQALESIRLLTEEHDQVVNLIGTARQATGRDDISALVEHCRAILVVLGPHTRVEEQGLFPAMAGDFGDHIATLLDDHRIIETVLTRAVDGTGAGDPEWPAQVEAVFVLLREHILREQDGVFPAALATLSAAEWDSLDHLRSRLVAELA